jgi:uncharacterized membrane protein YjjB (DUF3815 family)
VAIACVGWVTNHFVGTKFPNQSEISAAVGSVLLTFPVPRCLTIQRVYSAFAVGVTANIYGRFFRGNAFAVMVRNLSVFGDVGLK